MQALTTTRLIIRNFREDDWEALLDLSVENGKSKYSKYDHKWPTVPDEVQQMARWFAEGDRFLAACDRKNGILLGLIAFNPTHGMEGTVYDLGYVFHPKAHGQGFATEACTAVLDYAFTTLGVRKMIAGTAAANVPSRRLLRRLGFTETAEATTSFQKDEFGQPVNFLSYSYVLKREDWLGDET